MLRKFYVFHKSVRYVKYQRCCYHSENIRVRFAPSPTGNLHLGGLRTALYNFLFAKSQNGKFILRIEDTDRSRVLDGAADQLQKDLNWAGIHLDEGPKIGGEFGPYIQSQRLNLYRENVQYLLDKGFAYRCFCSDRRLDLTRKEALRSRQVPKYDNRCRHLSPEDVGTKLEYKTPHCIRFKLDSGSITFNDLIYGGISYDVTVNEGDPIIMKSDGFPTYHFANIVDDHLMEITHVLRGFEWLVSTTKHIQMYRAFGWKPPRFAHLPLLLNSDGSKLSKRQGDIHISNYKRTGILPQALINFVALSGGGFEKDFERGTKPRCYSINELTQQFNIKAINSHSGKLMPERLLEFNRLELQRQIKDEEELKLLVIKVQGMIKQQFNNSVSQDHLYLDEQHIKSILKWSVNRINLLSDLFSKELAFLWVIPNYTKNDNIVELQMLEKFQEILSRKHKIKKESLTGLFIHFAQENDIKYNQLMKLLRTSLTGLKEGPSVAEVIEILGKKTTLKRLQTYLDKSNL